MQMRVRPTAPAARPSLSRPARPVAAPRSAVVHPPVMRAPQVLGAPLRRFATDNKPAAEKAAAKAAFKPVTQQSRRVAIVRAMLCGVQQPSS